MGTGTVAYLLTERSPLGISFERNICDGYLGALQEFSPTLNRECPSLRQESGYIALDASCTDLLSRLPACETIVPAHVALPLTPSCTSFIMKNSTYEGCVNAHQYDPGFILPEWYIYLDTKKEIVERSGGGNRSSR